MYLIAICDDETADLNSMERLLRKYEKDHPETEFGIRCFKEAESLLQTIRAQNYSPDLLLMDVYMAGKTGIETAEELRGMGNDMKIVFFTVSREHALDAFGVNAVQYLVKPVSGETLFPVIDRLLEERETRKKFLLLRVEGRIQRVAVKDIVFCEAQGKTQCLHLADGAQCRLRTTIAEIFGMLSGCREFVKVGVAYIVNLDYVDGINSRELRMSDGGKIYLPRGSYQALRDRYFEYYCDI